MEWLEGRVTPSITLTNAFLVDLHDHPVSAPDKGEEVFIQANFTTQGLPSDASYRVSYRVDGVTLESSPLTLGAGVSGSQSWQWYLGGWYAAPGTHNVTVSIDPTTYGTTSRSFSFTPVTAPDLPQKFINPIGGTPFQTWDITTYPDVDPRSPGFADYTGGHITFDGETGHDLAIANFTAMDAGVPAVAAADGTVVDVQDGNFDRNTVGFASTTPANYVLIDHGNGWQSWYYHLRSDSILVHVGDHVVAGQTLGLIGSSGFSTGAHIDFGVTHNGDIVEPYYDPSTYWLNPLPYQGTVRDLIDSGVTRSPGTAAADLAADERPVDANTFTQAAGQQLVVWFRGATIAGDTVAFKAYRPDGSLYTPLSYSFTATTTSGGLYYYVYFNLPSNLDLGTWHVGIEIAGVEMARDSFQVTTAGVAAAHVSQGSTYVPNGRTTPIDFGTAAPGGTPPQLTFTVANLGTAPLSLSNLVLPAGFSLVGSLPAGVAAGGSATFTVRMATDSSGTDAGILSLNTSDPNAPTYRFDIKGVVSGGNTGEVHGQVFDDLDGNGIENGAEAGLVGWTVALLNPADGSVLATTMTSFNGYYAFYNLAPGSYRVRETPPPGWAQTTADPADLTVGSGDVLASPFGVGNFAPTHFTVSALSGATAGSPLTFTVTAQDAAGDTITGYSGTVHFTSSDGQALLPADATLTNGVGTFTATLFTAGSQTLTATDTADAALTGSGAVSVAAAAADHFLVTTSASSPDVAGTPFDVTVTVQDAYGNTATGYTGTVSFTSADPYGASLPGGYPFTAADAGVHTFAAGATLYTAGTFDVTVRDLDNNLSGTVNVTVVAGSAVAFRLNAPLSAASGAPFDVTVVAVDAYGNTDTGYAGTVHFSSTDGDPNVALPADYAFQPGDFGEAYFAAGVTLVTPGDQLLTVTDPLSGLSGSAYIAVS